MAKEKENRAMPRIKLLIVACKRCGKPITTTSKSLLGLAALKAKYGSICEACMGKDEFYLMLKEEGEQL